MSSHTQQIRRWFDVPERRAARRPAVCPPPPLPAPGTLLWIGGASGSGKSTLLRRMRRHCGCAWIDVNRIPLPAAAVVDCFDGLPVERVLEWLSRLGLAEVRTWLNPPSRLSTGQRFRLRLAIALHQSLKRGNGVIACDEFGSGLDSVTAAVTARCVRRIISPATPLRAILAGSRDDLRRALSPDRMIECDFGTWRMKHADLFARNPDH